MSRYDELANKAADWSARSAQNAADCEAFARWFGHHFTQYLGAPDGMVEFVSLDADLRATGDRKGKRVPQMLEGPDGLQYFGLSMHLEVAGKRHFMIEQFPIGLRQDTNNWFAYWEGKPFEIPKDNLSKANVVFEEILKESAAMYDGPVVGNRRSIGFVFGGS